MTQNELLKELVSGGGGPTFQFPVGPDEAAALIASELAKIAGVECAAWVAEAIREWGYEWGNFTAANATESTYR